MMPWVGRILVLVAIMGATAGVRAERVLGDITIPRKSSSPAGFMPEAVFPHWKHRLYFTCNTCHDDLFKMELGADPITMDAISAGQYCGACHNSKTAFEVGFETCERCHYNPASGQ